MKRSTPPTPDPSLMEIWEKSKQAAATGDPVSESETDSALTAVHRRIDTTPAKSRGEIIWLKARYLVAAVALIVFGAWLLFTPKTVTVPHGEIATIELPDGTAVEMNSGSALSYSRFFRFTDRDVTLNGEAYFDVTSHASPFRVKANGTVTEVTGTAFNLRSWSSDPESETTLSVTEGSVLFFTESRPDTPVTLSAGMMSRWNRTLDTPAEPDSADPGDIIAWKENRMVFRDQPLPVIFDELERRYNIRIDVEVSGTESETITAYYNEPRSAAAILEDIGMVKGYRFAETANGFRIFK
jgi:transmembrane sensor